MWCSFFSHSDDDIDPLHATMISDVKHMDARADACLAFLSEKAVKPTLAGFARLRWALDLLTAIKHIGTLACQCKQFVKLKRGYFSESAGNLRDTIYFADAFSVEL